MATVAAYGGSGIGMGGGSSSDDEGYKDKRMRVVTDWVPSSDDDDEEAEEEVAEITESRVQRPNNFSFSDLTLNDERDLPPKLRHKRKMALKGNDPPKLRHKTKMASSKKNELIGKSRSTESLKKVGVGEPVKRRRLVKAHELVTRRASSAPIPAVSTDEDSDQDQYVDIIGVSTDEDDEFNQNRTGMRSMNTRSMGMNTSMNTRSMNTRSKKRRSKK